MLNSKPPVNIRYARAYHGIQGNYTIKVRSFCSVINFVDEYAHVSQLLMFYKKGLSILTHEIRMIGPRLSLDHLPIYLYQCLGHREKTFLNHPKRFWIKLYSIDLYQRSKKQSHCGYSFGLFQHHFLDCL